MKRILSGCVVVAISALFSAQAFADAEGSCDYNKMLASRESSGSYTATTGQYSGKYQMGRAALTDLGYMNKSGGWTGKNGITSRAAFLANPGMQEQIQTEWIAKQDQYLKPLQSYVGKPIPGCNGKILTQEGLRAGAHLVGAGGARSYLESNGTCGKAGGATGMKYNTTDANGTCAGDYMCQMSGCSPTQKDMSKKTCDVTMPMIEAINCANFPAELQSFCQETKPHLMTRAECTAAESWAEKAPKGARKEACEGSSFGPGTGSWSYVLACSWAKEVSADQDGVNNKTGQMTGATGPASDPQCMEKLKGMGVQFDEIGRYPYGSYNGTACIIENAVAYRGGAVPFGTKLMMTCDMAIAMEKWGQQMKSIGVTSYFGIGSLRNCGPMRDNTGDIPGSITQHALGKAVDVSGFNIGGMKINMGALLRPGTADGALAQQAKAFACSTFRRVLSPTYAKYIGAYEHFHVEWADQGKCR